MSLVKARQQRPEPAGRRSGLLLVGVSVAVVTAALGMLTATSAGSKVSGHVVAAARPPASVDPHGFPRTLSINTCGSDADLARRDLVIGYSYCDIAKLRRLNPKGIFLLQPALYPDGANGGGGMSVTYGSGLWHWLPDETWPNGGCDNLPGGVNLGCLRAFNDAYDALRNADGSVALLDNGTSGPPGWNLADPLGKGTRELVAKFIAYVAKLDGIYAKGWDGIFSDNWIYSVIGDSWAYGPNLDTNRDGKVDDYSVLRKNWDNGLNEVGTRLRSYLPGKSVVGNGSWYPMKYGYHGSDPQGWLKSSNGTMVEGIEMFYNSAPFLIRIASKWHDFTDPRGQPRYVLFLQNALTSSGAKLTLPSGTDPNQARYMLDPGVLRSMRWGLTLSLMSGAYYEIVADGNHDTRWWYDEYDGGKGIRKRDYLGQALGPPVQVRPGGVWRRDFEHGVAFNNSSPKNATISLQKPLRHLRGTQDPAVNDGKVVRSVTIPAHDGLILLDG